jgi:hypothetical protein
MKLFAQVCGRSGSHFRPHQFTAALAQVQHFNGADSHNYLEGWWFADYLVNQTEEESLSDEQG